MKVFDELYIIVGGMVHRAEVTSVTETKKTEVINKDVTTTISEEVTVLFGDNETRYLSDVIWSKYIHVLLNHFIADDPKVIAVTFEHK